MSSARRPTPPIVVDITKIAFGKEVSAALAALPQTQLKK